MIRKFIEQQPSITPEKYRSVPLAPSTQKIPKKRGRKKSFLTLKRYLLIRTIRRLQQSGRYYTREEVATALGLDPRCGNTLFAAFVHTTAEEDRQTLEQQQKLMRSFRRSKKITAVPVLEVKDIYRRDFTLKKTMSKQELVTVPKDIDFGEKLQYFAFVMPDNCMLHDGICKNDRIIAVRNVRPTHGDMVACKIPGVKTVTVRRFGVLSNPSFFELYEGGTSNALFCAEIENLIIGVVVGVERTYRPGRLPYPSDMDLRREIIPE